MVSFQTVGLALLVICFTQCNGQVLYRCSYDSVNQLLTMTVRTEKTADYQQLVGIDDTYTVSTCLSSEDVVGSTTYVELSITTDSSRTQTSPAGSCFVEENATPTAVDYNIVGQSDVDYILGGDRLLQLTCDTATASNTFIAVSQTGLTVLSELTAAAVTASNDAVTFEIRDSSNTAVSDGIIGADYTVAATYTRASADPSLPLFVSFTLEVAPDNTFANSITMLDSSGCVNTGISAFQLAAPFDETTASPDPATTTVVEASTGTFAMAAFLTSTEVHFRLSYRAVCYVNTEAECFDVATFCSSGRRRKRSADSQDFVNGTLDLAVNVVLNTGTTSGLGGDAAMKEKECDAGTRFWIVAIVLAALLLVVLVFTVMLYLKLRNVQQGKAIDGSKFGVNNPSF